MQRIGMIRIFRTENTHIKSGFTQSLGSDTRGCTHTVTGSKSAITYKQNFHLSAKIRKKFYLCKKYESSIQMKASPEFEKYASLDRGISPMTLHRYASYINPTIIEERELNVAQIDVFSRLLYDRIIWMGVDIDDDVANIIQAQMLFLANDNPDLDICLYINSRGGSVSAGLGIYDTMQLVKPDVATTCTGMAASMASVLLCAGAKGKRSALKHSRVMIHQPLGGVRGQASDILIEAREIENLRRELYEIISTHSGQKYDKVFADSDRNHWMNAAEALEYGMIDKIL